MWEGALNVLPFAIVCVEKPDPPSPLEKGEPEKGAIGI